MQGGPGYRRASGRGRIRPAKKQIKKLERQNRYINTAGDFSVRRALFCFNVVFKLYIHYFICTESLFVRSASAVLLKLYLYKSKMYCIIRCNLLI